MPNTYFTSTIMLLNLYMRESTNLMGERGRNKDKKNSQNIRWPQEFIKKCYFYLYQC